MSAERCACGEPLHYADSETERIVRRLVAELGPTVKVVSGSRAWLVPRHYIALHGIKSSRLPALAQRYGFQEVAP